MKLLLAVTYTFVTSWYLAAAQVGKLPSNDLGLSHTALLFGKWVAVDSDGFHDITIWSEGWRQTIRFSRWRSASRVSRLQPHRSPALLRSRVSASARAYFNSQDINSSSISPSEGGCSMPSTLRPKQPLGDDFSQDLAGALEDND
jgi:hypothetical protein